MLVSLFLSDRAMPVRYLKTLHTVRQDEGGNYAYENHCHRVPSTADAGDEPDNAMRRE